MSRFIRSINRPATRTVQLGPCECPGTPHENGDAAGVYEVIGWDDLYDVGVAAIQSQGAGMRVLVTRALASWTLLDEEGNRAPIDERTVRLLNEGTINVIVVAANEAYEKAQAPLPNESSEGSPRLPPEPDTSVLTTLTPAKPTN